MQRGHKWWIIIFLVIMLPFSFVAGMTNEKPSLDLYLTISSQDVNYIDYQIEFNTPQSDGEYSSFNVIIPFPTDELLQCPSEIICSLQNRASKYTVLHMLVPNDLHYISIKLRSKSVIVPQPESNMELLEIEFGISDEYPELAWLKRQNNTIYTFDEIKVVFPFIINFNSIFESPKVNRTIDRTRVYTYESILNNDGLLSIHYPSAVYYYGIIAGAVAALAVEFFVAFFTIQIDKEKIEKNLMLSSILMVSSWIADLILIYFWLVSGNWPLNSILVVLIPPSVTSIIGTFRILPIVIKNRK